MAESIRGHWENFVYDLKHSWYFKVWLVFTFICFVVCIVAMGKYADNAAATAEADGFRTIVTHPNQIEFPTFLFHTSFNSALQISSVQCMHNGAIVFNSPSCPQWGGGTDATKCVQINTAGVVANRPAEHNFYHNPSASVECQIKTTPSGTGDNNLLGFQILEFEGGSNAHYPTWLKDSNRARVLLTKENIILDYGDEVLPDWHHALVYETSLGVPGVFNVTVQIDKFIVLERIKGDYFDGWMSGGDLGGFVFLVYLTHAVAMGLVALILRPDSRWLGHTDGDKHNEETSSFTSGAM